MKLLLCVLFAAFVVIMPCEGAPVSFHDLQTRAALSPVCASLMAVNKLSPTLTISFLTHTAIEACTLGKELRSALKADPRAVCRPQHEGRPLGDCLVDFYEAHGQTATSLTLVAAALSVARQAELKQAPNARTWQLEQVAYQLRLFEVTDLRRHPLQEADASDEFEAEELAELLPEEAKAFRYGLERTEGMLTKYRSPAAAEPTETLAAEIESRLKGQKSRDWSVLN